MKICENVYLDVGNGHQLWASSYGNENGIPVIFFHGGPGLGCSESDLRFFDLEKFFVILFDQRGAGKSTPLGSIENNTTQHLLDDVSLILDHFDVEKAILFGGSWGSALSLLYGIAHPYRVLGMVLRGIFLADHETIDLLFQGGTETHFPDHWEEFIASIPKTSQKEATKFLLEQLQSEDLEIRNKYLKAWVRYETTLVKPDVTKLEIESSYKKDGALEDALVLMHYSAHYCFLNDGFILQNIAKLMDVPIRFVHGRYDFICPPKKVFQLHQKLPKSHLRFELGGHLASDPLIEPALIEELNLLCLSLG